MSNENQKTEANGNRVQSRSSRLPCSTSDTPRTDALWQNAEYEALREDHKISRWADHARELERENKMLRNAAARIEGLIEGEIHRFNVPGVGTDPSWESALDELRRALSNKPL